MPKKFYTSMPHGYAVCQLKDCAMAQTCLHQLAYNQLVEKETYLNLINPKYCSQNGNCEFYRNNQPVTYARGFTEFQKKMLPEQYKQFTRILINQFSRNCFYERRRGATALSPKEQQIVRQALVAVGMPDDLEFDRYEDNINWLD